MNYRIEFSYPHISCDNFDKHIAYAIAKGLSYSRLYETIDFLSYANISFDKDDSKCVYPNVTELESYNKNNTNCLVFNINKTEMNIGFDKMFVYHSNGKVIGNYGYVLYNTETNESFHKPFITDEISDLFISVSELFTNINDHRKLFENNYI